MKKVWPFLKENAWILAILMLASFLRFALLGELPQGTYADEAYGAYIANGLLTEGIDDRGYSFPVYFVAWGSGMNALYPYLGMVFFKLFGVSLLVYRIPQALVGVLSVGALYVLCREFWDKNTALLCAFALAVNPWHIMMCRFGLESNLAPGMFLIGLMFLALGLRRKAELLIPSAVFFGLTLYSYALTWFVMPLFFLLTLICCHKWILPLRKKVLPFVVILSAMALPLLIFIAVNYGCLPEIRTPFFSIPKLTEMRSGEISLQNIKASLYFLFKAILVEQDDRSLLYESAVGIYYYFTTPFFVFGVLRHMYTFVRRPKNGEAIDLSFLLLAWLISAGTVSVLNQYVSIIHINMLHIPVIFYGAYGICQLAQLLKSRLFFRSCAAFYAVSLCFFAASYVHMDFDHFYGEKPYAAVRRAREIAGEDGIVSIFGDATYKFPHLFWREKWDIRDYCQNAVYDEDAIFADLIEYAGYRFILNDNTMEEVSTDDVYVIHSSRMWDFYTKGFEVEQINERYAVAAGHIPPPAAAGN